MSALSALSFLIQSVAYASPVLFASLGEVFTERAGVINIGLDGLLLIGALAGVVAGTASGSAAIGVYAAVGAGIAGAAVFALVGVTMRRDQVIVGTIVNFLALGLTGMLYRAWTGAGSSDGRPVPTVWTMEAPGGGINALTVLAIVLVPVAHFLLYRTRLGVTIRACGERPAAAASGGANVQKWRFMICLASGALCGLGGAALSLGIEDSFSEGMTNGRGFIALAVVVFGRWSPFGALGASLLFAAADVLQARLQAIDSLERWLSTLHMGETYPFFLAVPYVLTLAALAMRGSRVRPPAALGEQYDNW